MITIKLKKCSKCGIISSKSNFHKNKLTKSGVRSDCITCRRKYYNENQEKSKKYYSENRDRINNNQRLYNKQNRTKINLYEKRREIDFVYKLANNIRLRTIQSFKAQNVRKTNKTFDLLGCSHSFFKSWIIHQLYGDMSLDNYGSVWQIDHCLAIASFNLLDEKEMKKCFNWINLRPMYCSENISKGDKIDEIVSITRSESKIFFEIK